MTSVFLSFIREFMTARRYARRTIDTYEYWIRFYIVKRDSVVLAYRSR